MPQASSLAAAIERELGVEPELVRGDNGIFDVVVDDERIFCKDDEDRFPTPAEILSALRQRR